MVHNKGQTFRLGPFGKEHAAYPLPEAANLMAAPTPDEGSLYVHSRGACQEAVSTALAGFKSLGYYGKPYCQISEAVQYPTHSIYTSSSSPTAALRSSISLRRSLLSSAKCCIRSAMPS